MLSESEGETVDEGSSDKLPLTEKVSEGDATSVDDIVGNVNVVVEVFSSVSVSDSVGGRENVSVSEMITDNEWEGVRID